AVVVAGGQEPAVRAERHAARTHMGAYAAIEVEDHPACRQVPDLDGAIGPGGGQTRAQRMERHAADLVRVAAGELKWSAGPHVEQTDGPVLVGGGQAPAVGTEGQAADAVALTLEGNRIDPAEPLEVGPFPVAQVFRALVEELEGAAQVVRGQLAM